MPVPRGAGAPKCTARMAVPRADPKFPRPLANNASAPWATTGPQTRRVATQTHFCLCWTRCTYFRRTGEDGCATADPKSPRAAHAFFLILALARRARARPGL
jgi:hypothetical protein